jgi:hypothetical protein
MKINKLKYELNYLFIKLTSTQSNKNNYINYELKVNYSNVLIAI